MSPTPAAGPAARPAPDARRDERRLVTVLFADVSGFTRMSEHLGDPEEVKELMNLVFDRLSQVITSHGGTIDKYIGDCVMAVFGAPRSFGDDAERACRAALQMQRELSSLATELEPRAGTRLQMRIGLNTGVVMAGWVGGADHLGYTVMGDAVNLASRMESACKPGRVLASANTQRLVADRFVTEDAGAFTLKGKSQPVRGHWLERERGEVMEDWTSSFEGVAIPFLGRERELAQLERAFSEARAGPARVVLLHGPSGQGKSRLSVELCRRLARAGEPLASVSGRASVADERPLGPVWLAIAQELEHGHSDVAAALHAHFERLASTPGYETVAPALLLAEQVLRAAQGGVAGRAIGAAQGAAGRRHLFWSMAALLASMTAHRPLVLVLSDAHLADETLWDFLAFLAGGEAPAARLLVLVEVQSESGARLAGRAGELEGARLTRLALDPLSDAELHELVGTLLGRCGAVPEWVTAWVKAHAEGNPLFAVEHVRSLLHLGILRIDPESGGWSIDAAPPTDRALPPSIHAALQANLDARSAAERTVIQLAAATGRVFWDGLLRALAMPGLTHAEVEATLQSLRMQSVLRRRERSSLEGQHEYRFGSDLFHAVAAGALPARERRQLHARAASLLESAGGARQVPLVLSRYLEEAGQPLRAASVLLDVAEARLSSHSVREAQELLEQVGRLASATPEPKPALWTRRGALSAELARLAGELPRALELVAAALAEADALPEGADRARLRGALLRTRGLVLRTRGDAGGAVEAFGEAVIALTADPAGVAALVDVRGRWAWSLVDAGRAAEAESVALATVAAYTDDPTVEPALAVALAAHHETLGRLAQKQRRFAEAATSYRRARALKERGGSARELSVSDTNLAIVQAMTGDFSGAAELFRRVLAVRVALGDLEGAGIAHANLTEALLGSGAVEEACVHLDAADGIGRRIGSRALAETVGELRARVATRPTPPP